VSETELSLTSTGGAAGDAFLAGEAEVLAGEAEVLAGDLLLVLVLLLGFETERKLFDLILM
jgi:hypothetical protein